MSIICCVKMYPGVYVLFLVGILPAVVEAAEEFQCEGKDSIEKGNFTFLIPPLQ